MARGKRPPMAGDTSLECRVHADTLRVMRAATSARATVERMLAWRERRRSPNPGGTARALDVIIRDDEAPCETVEILLPPMRDGRSLRVRHDVGGGVRLHAGHILKVPGMTLPRTMATGLAGLPVGDLVDLAGTGLAGFASALITDVASIDDGANLLIYTDAATVTPALDDVGGTA